MLGAIVGDIAGSRFEFDNIKTKDFTLLHAACEFTDDTVMTVAVAKAILDCDDFAALPALTVKYMRDFGQRYPNRGYGGSFARWLRCDDPKPYWSYGNGAAMRISPVGFLCDSEAEIKTYSHAVTAVTHDHPEGLKGAEAVATAVFLARLGQSKEEIFECLSKDYYPELKSKELTYPYMLEHYHWGYGDGSVTCQSSVPQALACFYLSTGFEDTVRTAVSIGGDSDTIAAMAGGIAEAYYGIPEEIAARARTFLPQEFLDVLAAFYKKVKNIRA